MRRLALILASLAAGLPAGAGESRDLYAVQYDMLLADYCALVDERVVAGYRAESAAMIARDHLDAAQQRDARSRAAIAFEAEWGNRGLGGSRPWCRDEGSAGAQRLAAAAP
jgi:hypothetical protein